MAGGGKVTSPEARHRVGLLSEPRPIPWVVEFREWKVCPQNRKVVEETLHPVMLEDYILSSSSVENGHTLNGTQAW